MLAKDNRLTKKNDLGNVFKNGRAVRNDSLVFKFVENKRNNPRFAFVISKKVSKKAVLRNRIKRIISESVRLKTRRLKKGIDGLFIVLPGVREEDFKKIDNVVERIFKQANLL